MMWGARPVRATCDKAEPKVMLDVVCSRSAEGRENQITEGLAMLGWAVTFLVVALVAALFGFGGIAGTAVEAAKLIFFVAVVLFAISAVVGLMRGRSPTL